MFLEQLFLIFLLIDFLKDQSCDQDGDDENNRLASMVKYLADGLCNPNRGVNEHSDNDANQKHVLDEGPHLFYWIEGIQENQVLQDTQCRTRHEFQTVGKELGSDAQPYRCK